MIFLQQHFKVGLRKQIMEGYFENKPLVGGIEIHLNEFQYFLSQRSHPASSSIDTHVLFIAGSKLLRISHT